MKGFKHIFTLIKNETIHNEILKQINSIENEYSQTLGFRFMIYSAKNLEDAILSFNEDPDLFDLFIVEIHVLESSMKTSLEQNNYGLKFLNTILDRDKPRSAILICPEIDQDIADFQSQNSDGIRLHIASQKDSKGGMNILKQKFLNQFIRIKAEAPKKLGKIDIFLDSKDNTNEYRMVGEGFTFSVPRRALKGIDPFLKMDLVERSKRLIKQENWNYELHTIGGYLLRSLFDANPHFFNDFKDIVHKAGGEENIRIRYIVEENIHPIVLEALLNRNDEYYMLNSPVYRTISLKAINAPLFKDSETRTNPINFLIIDANSCGKVEIPVDENNSKPIKFPLLKETGAETRHIENYLNALKNDDPGNRFRIGKVYRLDVSDGAGNFLDIIHSLVENNVWHVVHFAGHSHYDDHSKKGFLFYPGKRRQPKYIMADDFAYLLRKAYVRLVYLSSCSSSDVDFVFKFAKQYIPAVIGFRWPIDDLMAKEHATVFYEKLLTGSKRLEYAFLETRKHLAYKKRYKDKNCIWAASILTMQSEV